MSQKRTRPIKPNIAPMLLAGIGLILLSLAFVYYLANDSQITSARAELENVRPPATVNFPMPEIELTDLDGQPFAMSDYSGKVILYNAWATWCPPCKEEMPALQAYYEKYADKGFVIVAIEDGQPIDDVRAFAQSYGLTFPVIPDPGMIASRTLGIDSLPRSYIIDREGNVRYIWTGAVTMASLEQYVTPMLGE